jgi:hypothetical protein
VNWTENWALAMSWDPTTCIANGIILGVLENETVKELSTILNFISGTRSQMSHPMFVPVLLCEVLLDKDSDEVKRHARNLLSVEYKTRMHIYPTQEDSISRQAIFMDIDFDGITKSLNGISSRLSFHQMRVETSLRFLESIEEYEKYFRPEAGLASSEQLKVRLTEIRDGNIALLLEINFNQRKAQTQLEVVSTLKIAHPISLLGHAHATQAYRNQSITWWYNVTTGQISKSHPHP